MGDDPDRHDRKFPSDFQMSPLMNMWSCQSILRIPKEFALFHGILIIKSVKEGESTTGRATARVAPPLRLGSIIGSFKSRCVIENLRYIRENGLATFHSLKCAGLDNIGKFWQRNYHDQIIRNEDDLDRFRKYIIENPDNWSDDEHNPG